MITSRNSEWIAELEKQLRRQKHVVLYGNVYDHCLYNNRYLQIGDFLNVFFADLGFEVVVRYDPIDGFVFPGEEPREADSTEALPEDARARFTELVRRRDLIRLTPQDGDPIAAPRQIAAPVDPTVAPPRAQPPAPRRSGQRIEPEEAFSQLRVALGSSASSCVAIVDVADLLTSESDRYAEAERRQIAILKKATFEASIVQEGPASGFRNTLIVVASELKRVPAWLYHDNPYVTLVHATRPAKDERRFFFSRFGRPAANWSGFYRAEALSEDQLGTIAEELADLTEGFQTVDLNAMRVTSVTEEIPLDARSARRLVDYYKFGLKEDPWEKLNRSKIEAARTTLAGRVLGQPAAVDAVVAMLTTSKVGLTIAGGAQSGKPKGVFFFVGPTGVGKTELAKAVTELVFADERAFARFDMSEYKEEHAAEKLAGAPPGFVGYDEGGQLTNRVIAQPHSILLFDEIEKAHPRVLDKFLQILEDGRLTDGKGQTAYFAQTAIIFTSNIGASDAPNQDGSVRPGIMPMVMQARAEDGGGLAADIEFAYERVEEFFKREVEHYFTTRIARAELLNRLGENIVVFDLLRPEYVRAISEKFLRQIKSCAQERFGANLVFLPSVYEWVDSEMRQGNNLLYGGRRIKALLERYLERPLNAWLFGSFETLEGLRGRTLSVAMDSAGQLLPRVDR